MVEMQQQSMNELVRAGTLLSRELEFSTLVSVLVEQSIDITRSDLACLYLHKDPERDDSMLVRAYRRGGFDAPDRLDPSEEWIEFLLECDETVVLLERKTSPFAGLLLNPEMNSGIALPLSTSSARLGVLVLNGMEPNHFDRERFHFLDSFTKLAGGLLHNARLFQELKEYLAKIEALEHYQANIFTSMTNLLVTTDRRGRLRYFNEEAGQRLGLREDQIGTDLTEVWRGAVDSRILRAISKSRTEGKELLGVEGIYKSGAGEIDFALNVSPLKGGGNEDGMTLLFTDQTREKELQGTVEVVVEERRQVKDMFARYLSSDIVQTLMESPDLVKMGGETKEATVLFADIRGYTSFSEGRSPEAIIKILNEYFTEAVEIIIRQGGYIDKFIGDAIMAAWGVPLSRSEDETGDAVAAALSIQQLIGSTKRGFFRGDAEKLRVGIGMHTGPLVAGNLGSSQRMDYTVIGDTVNIAARLEGVAGPGEVIITQETRERLGDRFILENREPVKVKGKAQPIRIYSVTGLNR